MHIYRIDFDWSSAMPGRPSRAGCYRFSRGVRYITAHAPFTEHALPTYADMIAAEARRMGLKDVQIRIRRVVRKGAVKRPDAGRSATPPVAPSSSNAMVH